MSLVLAHSHPNAITFYLLNLALVRVATNKQKSQLDTAAYRNSCSCKDKQSGRKRPRQGDCDIQLAPDSVLGTLLIGIS